MNDRLKEKVVDPEGALISNSNVGGGEKSEGVRRNMTNSLFLEGPAVSEPTFSVFSSPLWWY